MLGQGSSKAVTPREALPLAQNRQTGKAFFTLKGEF
jgi:hypothetical protein